ncbi:MAG: N-acetylmuramoyl-L-alanine amidase [Oscillospiraceae bacterium]|nr:N-acetylmuramoyl-L-alanine amidase [Oscillospiraceae bacterium]
MAKIKIYLSPSDQNRNVWGADEEQIAQLNTNESEQMREFALTLKEYFERAGFEVYLPDYYEYVTYDNNKNPLTSPTKRINESNALGVDFHIALHSNASNTDRPGPELIYSEHVLSSKSKQLSELILATLYDEYVSSGNATTKVRDLKNSKQLNAEGKQQYNFAELREPNAVIAYIEIAFHQNKFDIKWMENNWNSIAIAITAGVNYYVYGLRDESGNLVRGADGKPIIDKNHPNYQNYLDYLNFLEGGEGAPHENDPEFIGPILPNYMLPHEEPEPDLQLIELMMLTHIRPDVKKSGGGFFIWRGDVSKSGACSACSSRDGEIRARIDEWKTLPPLHPNCKCKIVQLDGIRAGTATMQGLGGVDFRLKTGGKIGGAIYNNSSKKLPDKSGRIWRQVNIQTPSGLKQQHGIFYSNDGLVFISYDGGESFYAVI